MRVRVRPRVGVNAGTQAFPRAALRSSGQLLVGSATVQLGIFIAGVLVARSESAESFGLYASAFALGSVTVGGVAAGLPILLLRRAAEGDLDRPVLRRSIRLQATTSLLAAAVAALAGAIMLGGRQGAAAGGVAGIFFTANHLGTLGQCVQSGRRRYRRASATDVVAGTLFPVLTFAALELGTGVVGALAAISVACILSWSIAWTALPDLVCPRGATPLRLRDGFSFSALGLMKAGYGRVDTVTVGAVAGAGPAGVYAAGYRLLGPFYLVGNALATIYFSRLSEHNGDQARWLAVRRRGRRVLVATVLVGALALLALAPALVEGIYGPRYAHAAGPLRILLLSVLPWALYWPRLSELCSVHLEKRAAVALGASLVLNVLLVAALAPAHGATGAAWAWVASEVATLVMLVILGRGVTDRLGARPPAAGNLIAGVTVGN